jgi:hypothetical protein
MTTQVEGHTAFVPYGTEKELGNETTTTSSAASVEGEKADMATANENDVPVETDEKSASAPAPVDPGVESDDDPEADYLPMGPKLILITVSLMMAVFCVALDNTVSLRGRKASLDRY